MASIQRRLSQTAGILSGQQQPAGTPPWDPDSSRFPRRKDLPRIEGAPDGAAWVWGKDDNVRTGDLDVGLARFTGYCVLTVFLPPLPSSAG